MLMAMELAVVVAKATMALRLVLGGNDKDSNQVIAKVTVVVMVKVAAKRY